MKPVYANCFGIRKNENSNGDVIEVTIDIGHKYMESSTTLTPNGAQNVAAPAYEQIGSIVLTPAHALALRDLLDKTLQDIDE